MFFLIILNLFIFPTYKLWHPYTYLNIKNITVLFNFFRLNDYVSLWSATATKKSVKLKSVKKNWKTIIGNYYYTLSVREREQTTNVVEMRQWHSFRFRSSRTMPRYLLFSFLSSQISLSHTNSLLWNVNPRSSNTWPF